jgi:hypothetical protein
MHHPDIHEILATVKDYYILTNHDIKFQLKPTIYSKPSNPQEPTKDIKECKGLKIVNQLQQGILEVNIFGIHEDYNCLDFQYFGQDNLEKPLEIIDYGGYNKQLTRDAIRKIMIIDRDRHNKFQVSEKNSQLAAMSSSSD